MSGSEDQNAAKTNPAVTAIAPDDPVRQSHVDLREGAEKPRPEKPTQEVAAVRGGQRDPYLGLTIDGRYRIEAALGEGGMGVVYLCVHTIIGKKVAMKILRPDFARDAEVTERFVNEARSASAIGSPHIIDISDFGTLETGAAYFVMEFLEGTPLSGLAGAGCVPPNRVVHIVRQLAEGLHDAHEAGIVHRDLKPENIFLIERGKETDFVKILDFGIAKVTTHATQGKLTRAGAVFGTPHYMSPEQAAGRPVDRRTDVYSMGVIMYELLCARVPFDADTFMGILTQHMYKQPVPFRRLENAPTNIPSRLEAIVFKCLSKQQDDRYETMEALIADLDRFREGTDPIAVDEIANRSGSFDVTPDYFRAGVTASPSIKFAGAPKSRWSIVAGIVAAVAAAIAFVAWPGGADPELELDPTPGTVANADADSSVAPHDTAAVALAAALPATRQVMVVGEPHSAGAHVFVDGTDRGESPVTLEIPVGGSKEITLRAPGYEARTLEVDDAKETQFVTLTAEKSATQATKPKTTKPKTTKPRTTKPRTTKPKATEPKATKPKTTKPKEQLGGSELVDPWN